jgi:hypothetical protein
MNTGHATTLDTLFAYGQTRERYQLPAGSLPIASRLLRQLVRPEYITSLATALDSDRELLICHRPADSELSLSPITRQCLWELHSGIFLRLLENISGYSNLIPDTHCRHLIFTQANQPLHLDNWHDTETNLQITAYLCIGLVSGDGSLLGRTAESFTPAEPVLSIAYMTFCGDPE